MSASGHPIADERPVLDRELLRRLPKAELHCHLDGSIRPQTLLDLGQEQGIVMPAADAAALADHMRVDDATNLEEYLDRFAITLSVTQTAAALERVAYELVEDAARDGVRYLEMRYAPVLNIEQGLAMQDVVEATLRGAARAERDHGTVARTVLCAMRHQPPERAVETAELAVAFRDRGVVGFDLAGGEQGNPASRYVDAFRVAQRHDVACTCHAGEGDGADSVRDALHVCGAHRLGHATRLIEDRALTDEVNALRTPLEICITSNVQTRAASSLERHPFREYFDRGLNVVLNTDNRLMSGVTLTDEYLTAGTSLGFSFDELATVALNGFESAFLPPSERARLLDAARRDIAALRHEVRS